MNVVPKLSATCLLPCSSYWFVDGFQGSMPPMPGAPPQLHAGQSHMPGGMPPGMQNMSQPGSPAGGQPGSASRIDPNQIPRPQSTTSPLQFDTRVNGSANLPPVYIIFSIWHLFSATGSLWKTWFSGCSLYMNFLFANVELSCDLQWVVLTFVTLLVDASLLQLTLL